MTRSLSNLLKWGYVNVDSESVRVIDSNGKLAQKLGGQMESTGTDDDAMAYELQDFDEPVTDGMDALFGESAEGGSYAEESEAGFDGSQGGALEDGGDLQEADSSSFEEGMEAPEYIISAQQAQQIIEQAQLEAQEILAQANEQASTLANQAYEQAKIDGRQDGYQEGIGRAQQEIAQREAELNALELELKQKYEEQLLEMEPFLVTQLSAIYEHLIGVELAPHKSVLMHLIDHTLHSTEAAHTYLIHVSEQDYSYVSMQKGQLLEAGGQENASLEVIEDKALSKNQCLIETENGVFDCSLSVQLEELKRKLILLSYTGKGM